MKQKIIIFFIVLFSSVSGVLAQEPEAVPEDSVILVDNADIDIPTFEREWEPVLVDHSIGIRAGWGTGMIRREPTRQGVELPYPLWNFGLTYRFDVPEQKYVGTIMFELQYVQKGYAYNYLFDGKDVYSQSYDVIELPILWQPYIPIGDKGSRVYLNAGPFISYTLSSHEKSYNSETGQVYFDREYEMDPNNDYYWNYGISAGVGFYIAVGRFSITCDGRYTIQLSDIQRGPEFIPGNPFRTPVDHLGVSLGLQYKFSIGKDNKNGK